MESKRRDTDKAEAFLQRQLRAETIKRANDKLYEQTGKMKLLRSNLLYAEVIEVRVTGEQLCVMLLLLLPAVLVKHIVGRQALQGSRRRTRSVQETAALYLPSTT